MRRALVPYLASLVMAGALSLPTVLAQANRNNPDADSKERPPPALQYTVASVATLLIMVILCVPSRKRSMN